MFCNRCWSVSKMLRFQLFQIFFGILIQTIFRSSSVVLTTEALENILQKCRSLNKTHYFLNDPNACNSYFLCTNETVTIGECPFGFHFNEKDQICDHPKKVRCANPECPRHIGFIPRLNSCTQYHLCSQGIVIRDLECPNGSHFDVVEERCNYPEIVQCGRDVCPQQRDAFDIIMRPHPDECKK